MEEFVLDADTRTATGKKNRALRANGVIPIHVYGLDDEPAMLQVEEKRLTNILREAGRTAPVTITSSGGKSDVTLVRDVATHPVSGNLLHVDFLRVDATQAVQAPVPVILINQELAPGIRGGAGFVTQGVYEVTVEARPSDIPQSIQADCEVLETLNHAILAGELLLGDNVVLASDPTDRIAWIQPPRVSESDDDTDEEGELIGADGTAEASATSEGESTD